MHLHRKVALASESAEPVDNQVAEGFPLGGCPAVTLPATCPNRPAIVSSL